MKISQGNPCVATCIKNKKNAMFFFLSFLFFHLQNQRTGGENRSCEGGVQGLILVG
jgi:hypothetical protein